MKFLPIAFCTLLLAAATAACAQTKPGDLIANVPFDFVVAGQPFPAGRYIVTREGDACVRILNSQRRGLFVPTHPVIGSAAGVTKLEFHHYGDKYFLASIWLHGNATGQQLYPSRAEKELSHRKNEMEIAVVTPTN